MTRDNTDSSPEPDHSAEYKQMDSLEQARMSIMEHLAELRIRLIYAIAWFLVGCLIAWVFRNQLFAFLTAPLEYAAAAGASPDVEANAAQIHHKDLAEPFFVFLKIAGLAGAFIASPGILYQVWKFIAPGLYDSERKMVIPFVLLATLFFFGGAAFCFYLVMPYGYSFLLTFSAGVSEPQLMMQEYFQIASKLLIGFGLIFELPVFSMFLSALGVIDHRTLLTYWRVSIVGAFLMAAIFTPPDIMTQAMMAGPLIILYGLSIGVAWLFARRREKQKENEEGLDDGEGEE